MRAGEPEPRECALCRRAVPRLTRHHLIPRTRHHNRRNKRDFARGDVHQRIAWLCPACHRQIHAVLSEKELERDYNTVDSLRAHPTIRRFADWLSQRPPDFRPRVQRHRRRR